MVYVVERYLPGVSTSELECALDGLRRTTREMRGEGMPVRYLGSTIVPDDEACFCEFEGPSQAAVAAANRRAGVAFDRIVNAVAVPPAAKGASDVQRDDSRSRPAAP